MFDQSDSEEAGWAIEQRHAKVPKGVRGVRGGAVCARRRGDRRESVRAPVDGDQAYSLVAEAPIKDIQYGV